LPLGLPDTLSRAPLRRRAPFAWLARDARARDCPDTLARAASSARSVRVARSQRSLARLPRHALSRHSRGRFDISTGVRYSFAVAKGSAQAKTDVLQGTLDLMILKTLDTMGPLHGYGVARRIEQISDAVLKLNEGTVYASLMRLRQQGWVSASWGASDNNRRAKFYEITQKGRRQLTAETENWERISGVIGRLLRMAGEP
jgi:PadR family transcriptional regulator